MMEIGCRWKTVIAIVVFIAFLAVAISMGIDDNKRREDLKDVCYSRGYMDLVRAGPGYPYYCSRLVNGTTEMVPVCTFMDGGCQ